MRNYNYNKQLGIGVAPSPINPTRYTRGLQTVQPQLATEDWALDYYNDTAAINNMSNADGWGGDSIDSSTDDFEDFLGGYPACIAAKCKICKSKCKYDEGLGWKSGGKECHKSCVAKYVADKKAAQGAATSSVPTVLGEAPENLSAKASPAKSGMSKGAKIGITVGVLAIVGVGAFLLLRKKK